MGDGIQKGSVGLQDKAGDSFDVESRSSGVKAIDIEHGKIHDGNHYYVENFVSIGNGATYEFLIVAPSPTPKIHVTWEVEFQLESTVTVTEAVTVAGNGTTVTLLNNDRNSSNTPSVEMYHTPNTPAGGAVISRGRKGDGQRAGGLLRSERERIYKTNAKYLVSIENHGATSSLTNYLFNIYEEF
jgi:hypothetical protein